MAASTATAQSNFSHAPVKSARGDELRHEASTRLTASLGRMQAHVDRLEIRTPASMSFQCAGIACHASLNQDGGQAVLNLKCTLGHLPYSAESPIERRAALDVIAGLANRPDGLLAIDRLGRLIYSSNTALPQTATDGDCLLGYLTVIVIQIRKSLDELTTILR